MQIPLLITTTSDAVPAVYASLPAQRRQDTVFTSNGMFLRFFAQEEVPECTQALLYLSGASTLDAIFPAHAALDHLRRNRGTCRCESRHRWTHHALFKRMMRAPRAALDDGTLTDGKDTVVTGRHAETVQGFFHDCGLTCTVLQTGPYTAQMVEKLVWSSVLWLVCHSHGGKTVRGPSRPACGTAAVALAAGARAHDCSGSHAHCGSNPWSD